MSLRKICDYCQNVINNKDDYVRIEYKENTNLVYRDYHIDCFNYKFNCDIRKLKHETN